MRGTMRTAVKHYTRAIDLARAHDLPRDLSANLHNRSAGFVMAGDLAAARADAWESIELAQRLSNPMLEIVARNSGAWEAMLSGNLDDAIRDLETALDLAVRTGPARSDSKS